MILDSDTTCHSFRQDGYHFSCAVLGRETVSSYFVLSTVTPP